jgi:hypothetical protein
MSMLRSVLLGFSLCAMLATPADARGRGPHYGGGHHTTSHGATYRGGSGSSQGGGHCSNPRTHDNYGRHK